MEKIIPLNIVATYPVRWGKYQVIRDFVQNFYDAIGYSEWKEKFHYDCRGFWHNGGSLAP